MKIEQGTEVINLGDVTGKTLIIAVADEIHPKTLKRLSKAFGCILEKTDLTLMFPKNLVKSITVYEGEPEEIRIESNEDTISPAQAMQS